MSQTTMRVHDPGNLTVSLILGLMHALQDHCSFARIKLNQMARSCSSRVHYFSIGGESTSANSVDTILGEASNKSLYLNVRQECKSNPRHNRVL